MPDILDLILVIMLRSLWGVSLHLQLFFLLVRFELSTILVVMALFSLFKNCNIFVVLKSIFSKFYSLAVYGSDSKSFAFDISSRHK